MSNRNDGRAANGGPRPGAGRLPTSIPLSGPAIIYLRELTRARLGRMEVTRVEMGETVEAMMTKAETSAVLAVLVAEAAEAATKEK